MTMMRPRATVVVTISLLAALSGAAVYANDDRFDVLKGPKALPDFSLQDQYGSTFTRERLKDQWTLMFLGFTSCPDVCPVTLMKLRAVRDQMKSCVAEPALPEVVLVAVDPERDQGNLKDYLEHFGTHNTGITGHWEQIDKLVDGLGGAYRFGNKHGGHHGYEVAHTTAVYVINPKGTLVASMGMPLEESAMAQFLVDLTDDGEVSPGAATTACLNNPAGDAGVGKQ